MRIIQIITRRQLRGAEIFANQLGKEFIKDGHSVLFVALYSASSFPSVEGIEYLDLDLKPSDRFRSFVGWRKLSRIIRKWKPDIVQANASETLKFSVASKKLFGWQVPLVYRNANKVSDFIKSSLSLRFNKWLAHQVDFVISVSENCRKDYINVFRIDPALTATITIGTVIPVDNTIKSNIINLPARFWINVASLVPEKNHRTLLAFYKMYRERGGEADLVVVGDGKERKSLQEQSCMLSIDKYVHFLGYRKDAVQIMNQADGLILPSLIEGLPGVVLEALACKVPVIASAVGGIPEVIRHKDTGLLIGLDDKEEFCGAMFLLESNLSLKRTIVENGFTLCKSEYTIEKVAERFIQQYKSVIRE